MSRSRSRRQAHRPSGAVAATDRITDVAASFDAQIQAAALANPVPSGAPYGHVQQIVPGANYGGKPNTADAHARLRAMKQGVDPALNRKFETATEARAYRRQEGVDVMSPAEFEAETSHMGSSVRRGPAWYNGPIETSDPRTGKKILGYDPMAFRKGAQKMAEENRPGVTFG